MSEFFAMGGYALYVWPAFGISILTLIAAALIVFFRYERARRHVVEFEGDEGW